MTWDAYIILCSDDTLYTGITTDLQRRLGQHASGRGAKYFRGRQPVQVVYRESGHTRSSAGSREVAIKNLSRAEKELLIASKMNEINRPPKVAQPLPGRTKSVPAN